MPSFFEKPIENSSLFRKETHLRQPIIINYTVLMKHKGEQWRRGIQRNGIFAIRRISENSFKFSKRDNVSELWGVLPEHGAKYDMNYYFLKSIHFSDDLLRCSTRIYFTLTLFRLQGWQILTLRWHKKQKPCHETCSNWIVNQPNNKHKVAPWHTDTGLKI